MKLIGIQTGVYEGNPWARINLTEPLNRDGCIGDNTISSKANYNYIITHMDDLQLYIGEEVRVIYDRFGKVQSIMLDS